MKISSINQAYANSRAKNYDTKNNNCSITTNSINKDYNKNIAFGANIGEGIRTILTETLPRMKELSIYKNDLGMQSDVYVAEEGFAAIIPALKKYEHPQVKDLTIDIVDVKEAVRASHHSISIRGNNGFYTTTGWTQAFYVDRNTPSSMKKIADFLSTDATKDSLDEAITRRLNEIERQKAETAAKERAGKALEAAAEKGKNGTRDRMKALLDG